MKMTTECCQNFVANQLKNKRILLYIISTFAFVLLVTFNLELKSKTTSNEFHVEKNKTLLIVGWTGFFGSFAKISKVPLSQCPMRCIVSDNKSLVYSADAVLFHGREINIASLPKERNFLQRYVFVLMESPAYAGSAYTKVPKGYFNWTMTYRSDSDVRLFYDQLISKNDTAFETVNFIFAWNKKTYSWEHILNVTSFKTKMAVQIVSHCNTHSGREKYIEELAKSISIDKYGPCSSKKCGTEEQCSKMVTDEYRFYLSFENSVCRDYVTEKFWRMKMLIVPIVLRDSDYILIAPKGSYIAADQFSSPKELAAHLIRVANNHTEYLKYFEWTKHYWHSSEMWRSFCDLCQALHSDSMVSKSYDNIGKWWIEMGNCQPNFALNLFQQTASTVNVSTTKSFRATRNSPKIENTSKTIISTEIKETTMIVHKNNASDSKATRITSESSASTPKQKT